MIHRVLILSQVLASRVRFTILSSTPITLGLMWVLGIGGGRSAHVGSLRMIAKRELGCSVLVGLVSFSRASCFSCGVLHSLVHVLYRDNILQSVNIRPGRWTMVKSNLRSSSFQHCMVVWVAS
jgi:hypothetical protein